MNYADLFRVTLPETALEVAALIVLIVDLGFLHKAALKVRVTVAALLGVVGCGAALWAIGIQVGLGLYVDESPVLAIGGGVAVAQIGILVLTALTFLLLIDLDFTRHVGEYVAVVLMAATGGLLIASAQDLLVIFVGLELLSLGLYILTAFSKGSGKSAEAAMKYYLFGGMSAAFLLFLDRVCCSLSHGYWLWLVWVSRLLLFRSTYGRRIRMKVHPRHRRHLLPLSLKWRALHCLFRSAIVG